MLAKIWTGMIGLALLFGLLNNRTSEVGAAAIEGAGAAVTLSLGLLGPICLWTGVMNIMEKVGGVKMLSRLMRPLLGLLFPGLRGNGEVLDDIAANVTANILGLGNAATPMGLRAAAGIARLYPSTAASNELCNLVVLNTASLQLIPLTIAGVRAAYGSAAPFDILPAVWIASIAALSAGLIVAALLQPLMPLPAGETADE